MLSLHGHIHEARGHAPHRQHALHQPGQRIRAGRPMGALIELNGKKVKNFVLTSG